MAKKAKAQTAKETEQVEQLDEIRTLFVEGNIGDATIKIKKLTKAKRKARVTEVENRLLDAALTHNEVLLLNTELQIINDNL